jgi:hypothetical protein
MTALPDDEVHTIGSSSARPGRRDFMRADRADPVFPPLCGDVGIVRLAGRPA